MLNPGDDQIICQICGCEILEEKIWKSNSTKLSRDSVVYCKGCGTPHHNDCWNMTGMCSTYGCNCKVASPKRLHSASSDLIVIEDSPDDQIPAITLNQDEPVLDYLPQKQPSALWSFLTRDRSSLIPDSSGLFTIAFLLEAYAFPGYLLWKIMGLGRKKEKTISFDGCLTGLFRDMLPIAILWIVLLIGPTMIKLGLAIPALVYLLTAGISEVLSIGMYRIYPELKEKRMPALLTSFKNGKQTRNERQKRHKKHKKIEQQKKHEKLKEPEKHKKHMKHKKSKKRKRR